MALLENSKNMKFVIRFSDYSHSPSYTRFSYFSGDGLDMSCQERSEQQLCCSVWMKAGGEEKQMQMQNLALHCKVGERQTRMEHMDKSKTGSKQPPAVEGRCTGLVHLLAQRDLTLLDIFVR